MPLSPATLRPDSVKSGCWPPRRTAYRRGAGLFMGAMVGWKKPAAGALGRGILSGAEQGTAFELGALAGEIARALRHPRAAAGEEPRHALTPPK